MKKRKIGFHRQNNFSKGSGLSCCPFSCFCSTKSKVVEICIKSIDKVSGKGYYNSIKSNEG